MLKKVIYSLTGIFALTGFLFVVTVAVNAFDPALDPQVEQIVNTPLACTDRQKAAYFYVLGMYQGAKDDPEKAGAELWLKRDEPEFWKNLAQSKPWQTGFRGCPDDKCTVEHLQFDPKLSEALVKYHDQIESYATLMSYGEGCTLFTGDRKTFFGSISALPYSMHRLLVLQMAEWASRGENDKVRAMLIASNHYTESYYHTGSLLERMIAVSIQKQNAVFLNSELERNPKFQVTPELVNSFAVPDVMDLAQGAMDAELRVMNNLVHADLHLGDVQISPWDEVFGLNKLGQAIPARAFMRPNETLNHFHALSEAFLHTECKPDLEPGECVPGLKWTGFANPWHLIENPAGRLITHIILPGYFGRRGVLGRRREELANFQAKFRARIAPAHSRKTI